MTPNVMRLTPLDSEVRGDKVIRQCKIERMDNGNVSSEQILWFTLPASVPQIDNNDCDAYTIIMLMDAMQEARQIEVKGSVCQELLSNLVEFQGAWQKWRPGTYHQVAMIADEERAPVPPKQGAICAFSGGVDATFTVWRHTQNKWQQRSQHITQCVMVHGFDIPLKKTQDYERALHRAQQTLNDISLPISPAATNFRELSRVHWEDACAIGLVATLSHFKQLAGRCLIGSSEPYNALVIPWGSSPITDYLLSSSAFSVIHDGATHNRTEKVAQIMDWPAGIANLRVCWQGEQHDSNCGGCEKCLRTMGNFCAVGAPIPDCFSNKDFEEKLKHLTLKTFLTRSEWKQIYYHATANGISAPWVKRVKQVAFHLPLNERLLPKGSQRRTLVKRVLSWLK